MQVIVIGLALSLVVSPALALAQGVAGSPSVPPVAQSDCPAATTVAPGDKAQTSGTPPSGGTGEQTSRTNQSQASGTGPGGSTTGGSVTVTPPPGPTSGQSASGTPSVAKSPESGAGSTGSSGTGVTGGEQSAKKC